MQSCMNDVVDNSFYCEEKGQFFGNIELKEDSDAFWSYSKGQRLYFQDASGNELEFIEGDYDSLMQFSMVRILCGREGLPDYQFDYINAERRAVFYETADHTHSIYMSLAVQPWDIENNNLANLEVFNLTSNSSYFYFATAKTGNVNIPNYMLMSSYQQADTTLLGRFFENAYYREDFNNSGFYTKAQGLVAFYDNNSTLYVLDRIE